ncbi:hypothetical protein HaLaN_24120 [Haematococcus lacustris]|uniref:Uncharacterized protein n=1 Tax=Haematococcus lacustris TaxID=44745 RepID=A0A699ZTN7_HAELA|nr:hypothetical protein HaLaN_24120 [Haematococcus lacustris]
MRGLAAACSLGQGTSCLGWRLRQSRPSAQIQRAPPALPNVRHVQFCIAVPVYPPAWLREALDPASEAAACVTAWMWGGWGGWREATTGHHIRPRTGCSRCWLHAGHSRRWCTLVAAY